MTQDQALIIAIVAAAIVLFLWGRWRHDMVAVGALLACVAFGLVPAADAFNGFGHPAVITVAAVLVLSRSLQQSGVVDALARRVLPQNAGPTLTIAALTGLAAALSGFMNNVGALALLMPLGVQVAARLELPPGKVLMPLSFGSILGGMTTLIGTPPNLIVAGFRGDNGAGGFGMFDFTPVGLAAAAAGLLFVVLFGRLLVPTRERAGAESFATGAYLTEARAPESAKAAGMTLAEIEQALDEVDAQVIGLVRDEVRLPGPHARRKVRPNDILVIEAEPEALAAALSKLGLRLEEDVRKEAREEDEEEDKDKEEETESSGAAAKPDGNAGAEKTKEKEAKEKDKEKAAVQSGEILLMEFAVLPGSSLAGRSATDTRMRDQFGINLLAFSRQGRRSMARLRSVAIREGDVLLMQGTQEALLDFAGQFGCVPLAERPLRIPSRRETLLTAAVMGVAIAIAAFGLLPAAVAFTGGVLAAMLLGLISARNVYQPIDWPVIVLLGALIPVAGAMESTGAANLAASVLLEDIARGRAVLALALLLVFTMTLSDFMNNAATAAMMCPIALGAAAQLEANPDAFLMAVAVGASCAFLTPIGHQNNTLILGPGGFRFGDYWRLGLPLEIIVAATAIPMILIVWPL